MWRSDYRASLAACVLWSIAPRALVLCDSGIDVGHSGDAQQVGNQMCSFPANLPLI